MDFVQVDLVLIKFNKLPSNPSCSSFKNNRWCGTVSNALEKSKYIESIEKPLSIVNGIGKILMMSVRHFRIFLLLMIMTDYKKILMSYVIGHWLRPVKKFLIKFNKLPSNPSCSSFKNNRWCGTVSNALEKSKYDHDRLQENLDELCDWSSTWKLKFNAAKCKVLHFNPDINNNYRYTMLDSSDNYLICRE
jgi:hypothetical protein